MLLLILAYAGGAATSLALALLIGGRVFKAMKCSLGAGEWIRRGLGLALSERIIQQLLAEAGRGNVVPSDVVTVAPSPPLKLNQWALTGDWNVDREHALANQANGRIAYRFHARDLHLVLGPAADGKPVRFRVLIDGKPPLADHGMDVDAQGNGSISEQRLYQLIRQQAPIQDRLFEIEFLDPGAQAFAFTFG